MHHRSRRRLTRPPVLGSRSSQSQRPAASIAIRSVRMERRASASNHGSRAQSSSFRLPRRTLDFRGGSLTTDWQSLPTQSSCPLHPKADLRPLGRRLTTWPGTQAKRQSSCMIAAIIPARLRSRVALRGVDRDQRTISALMLVQRYANAVTILQGRYRRAVTAPLGARLRVRVSAT